MLRKGSGMLEIDHSCSSLEGELRELLGQVCSLELAAARYLGFRNMLAEELRWRSADKLLKEEKFRKILLGGFDHKLEPSPNALAVFYRNIYDVVFGWDELKKRVFAGVDLYDAGVGLFAEVREPPAAAGLKGLVDYIKGVFEAAREAARRASNVLGKEYSVPVDIGERIVELPLSYFAELEPSYEGRLESGEEGVEVFERLLKAALSLTPDCNKVAFKFLSFARVSRFFAEKAHPELVDRSCEEFLRNVMGWREYYVPEHPQMPQDVRREYTIMGYDPKSLGDALVKVLSACWDLIDYLANTSYLKPFGLQLEQASLMYAWRACEKLSEASNLIPPATRWPLGYYGRSTGYRGKYPYTYYFAIKMRSYDEIRYGQPRFYCVYYRLSWVDLKSDIREYLRLVGFMAPQMHLGIASVEKEESGLMFVFYTRSTPSD
jgi:hypothetical protein